MKEREGNFYEIHPEQVEYHSNRQLACVGRRLEDLRDAGQVVDLGAKDCYIERAARLAGIGNIISVDQAFPEEVFRMRLNLRQLDAADLNFPDNSIGLIISRAGPIYKEQEKVKGIKILSEMNRVLRPKPDGLILMHPARLGFIQAQLFKDNQDFFNAMYGPGLEMSPQDLVVLGHYNLLANKLSEEYLKTEGYDFEIGSIENRPELSDDLQTYLGLRKRN